MRKVAAEEKVEASSGNIFEDLGFPPKEALTLMVKAKIFTAILGEVRRKKYRQAEVVDLLSEHQPVVSNLLRGKISQMSIEKLLKYADRLGLKLDIHQAHPGQKRQHAARATKRQPKRGKIAASKTGLRSGTNGPESDGNSRTPKRQN